MAGHAVFRADSDGQSRAPRSDRGTPAHRQAAGERRLDQRHGRAYPANARPRQTRPKAEADKLQFGVGIRFKDRVRTDIGECYISEGWVRVQAGKAMDPKGQPITLKLTGPVEAWYEDLGENPPVARKGQGCRLDRERRFARSFMKIKTFPSPRT